MPSRSTPEHRASADSAARAGSLFRLRPTHPCYARKARSMKKSLFAVSVVLAAAGLAPLAAQAQNIAVVNGKPVPKARVDAIITQVQKQASSRGQQLPPNIDQLVRDKVVTDEIL